MKYLVSVTAIITLIFVIAFHDAIYQAIVFVGYAAAVLLGIASLMGIFFGVWYVKERIGLLRAQRRLADRDSHSLVVTSEHGVFIRETDKKATWLQIHQMPQWRVNGTPQEPTPLEVATYRDFLASRHARPALPAPDMLTLEAQPIPELLPILDNAQRVLIIGASNAGKTNLLQWVVSRRGVGVLVIDPHASPGKWPGAKVVGIGSNFDEIEAALDNLIEMMVTRYREIGQGLVREGEHPRLTIIIDEWLSIAYQCKNAHDVLVRLLTESRKAAFSVIIGSHSERVKSLGLDGKGDLRDGFLFIRLTQDDTGKRKATYDYGRGERPCVLPGKFEAPIDVPLIEIEAIGEVKPTPDEQRILDLFGQGKSESAIAAEVFGSKGGPQNAKVRNVLTKFDRV